MMRVWPYFVLILILGVLSCSLYETTSVVPPLTIPGAEYTSIRQCEPCHKEQSEFFENTTHARISIKGMEKEGMGCGICHGQGSIHVEKPYEPDMILTPRKHPEVCFGCHLDKNAEFRLQYHHPVLEGKVSCGDCHNPMGQMHARPWSLTSELDINEICFKCHPEQRGPFVFEHEALRDGCTICHKVHGSINDKLLIARDNNVCLQCHFQTQMDSTSFLIGNFNHASRIPRGTCFSADCHTVVHGSNFDDHLRY